MHSGASWTNSGVTRDDIQKTVAALKPVELVYAAKIQAAEPTAVLDRGDPEKKGEIVSAGGLSAVQSANRNLVWHRMLRNPRGGGRSPIGSRIPRIH